MTEIKPVGPVPSVPRVGTATRRREQPTLPRKDRAIDPERSGPAPGGRPDGVDRLA